MLRRTLTSLLAIAIIASVSGCSFKLRGYLEVPAELQRVQLVRLSGHHQLVSSVIASLQVNRVQINDDAPYRLELSSIHEERRSATLDSRAKVDEYEIKLRVNYRVLGNNNKEILTDQRLETERVYTYDPDAASAAAEQERLLKQEMADDLALQIVRRYLAIKPAP